LAIIAGNTAELNPLEKEDFYSELDRNAREGSIYKGFVSISSALAGGGQTLLSATNSLKSAIDEYAKATKETPHVVNATVYTAGGTGGTGGGTGGTGGGTGGNNSLTNRDKINKIKDLSSALDARFGADLQLGEMSLIEWYLTTIPESLRNGPLGGILLSEEEFYRDYDTDLNYFNGIPGFNYDDYVWFMTLVHSGLKGFDTGGLADYTGPAWLDGTKSKPEIVLNQTDSANFIILRDILADILDGTSGISQSGSNSGKNGDNYYDIEINVDNISDDYDVE
jgi:hypothetical protein